MKRILFTIYLTSLCCLSSVMGAIPNTEGLFRNPNNSDLAGNFVETKILFEELGYEGDTKAEKFKDGKGGLLKRYLRFVFSVDKDKRIIYLTNINIERSVHSLCRGPSENPMPNILRDQE